MLDLARYEARRRLRGTLTLTVLLGLFALLMIALFPSVSESGADFEAYVESLPPAVREGFGVSGAAFTTVEGFLSTEFYTFVWLLLLGLYLAYAAGGTVAGDIEDGRMDMLLATPITRAQVLLEKFLSLLAPVLVLNLVTPLFVYGGVVLVGESIEAAALVAVHLLSVPYLLACGALGTLLSVTIHRADVARRGGIGAVFVLFVLESVTVDTDYEWLGLLSPTRYYDPAEILIEESYDPVGAAVLVVATVALLSASRVIFERVDV
ncbi:ABC transporter permease [Salinirubellus sp. GCM10025818]|uniref:ABC transporter permease n=1 Tax=Salinirubellus TaxID=2162630 RepID=UPI0030D4986B